MTQKDNFRISFALLIATGLFGVISTAYSDPLPQANQRQKAGGGAGGGRATGGGAVGNAGGQQAHARREGVRTPSYVGRTQGGTFQPLPPVRQQIPPRTAPTRGTNRTQPPLQTTQPRQRVGTIPSIVQNQRKFTKTPNGRQYDNGIKLRKGVKVGVGWQKEYFPRGYVHFPYYHPTYDRNRSFYSPFSFYFGVCVPFIDISACEVFPPSVVFIDEPIYNGNSWSGYQNVDSDNIINDPNLDQNEPGLNNALNEIAETFQGGNIDGIVSLINPNLRVAIFLKGQYQYSMQANDYIDLTRDAIQSTQTVEFSLDYLHQRSATVFCASGHQTYLDKQGRQRTVYVSYVLQDIGGLWTLTQVETSPDIIQGF